jgi:imidazole glycerol-phosphate synthase subunit HisF
MLKLRVIPTLLWKDFGLVKGVGFDSWRRVGTILPAIKVYTSRDVDELILLDIRATLENRPPDFASLSEFAAECTVPLTFGGGIRNIATIRRLLTAGADKVAINSAVFDHPALVTEAADAFGSQCVVVSIDARRTSGGYRCASRAATALTEHEPAAWAAEMARRGAGEILITSVERDGSMEGYDVDLVKSVVEAVDIPVIASGGAGNYQHMLDAIHAGGASAVAAASIFHFTQQTPAEAKEFLGRHGVPVRSGTIRPGHRL